LRHGEHPRRILADWSGVMQADAFAGFNELYAEGRRPGPIFEAACWAHGRRDFFDLARLAKAPIAKEVVRRIDELFAIERDINGKSPDERRAQRQERSKPLVLALEAYLREQHHRLSPKSDLAKAIRYMLVRWTSSPAFSTTDGFVCRTTSPSARCEARPSGAVIGPKPPARTARQTPWAYAGCVRSDRGLIRRK
jgi:transposase